ncbi:MAG TPA: hypothetical protein PKD55_17620 [Bellilinea sp.]|nr:hypothetical protein [Bellilinea sp.]
MYRSIERADAPFDVFNPDGRSNVGLVCEHASAKIPGVFGNRGLEQDGSPQPYPLEPGSGLHMIGFTGTSQL